MRTFRGFFPETIAFLKELGENNNRTWYHNNKHRYKEYVLEPLQNLVMDLSEFMLTIDSRFETRPQIDKTISRIYRDTRFSKNKLPYRNNVWITFKRLSKEWTKQPGYYFEIYPGYYHYGMGFYNAPRAVMDKFRERINDRTDEFLRVTSFYRDSGVFELHGDNYKRILDDTKPPEILEWYQKKSFYLSARREISSIVFSSGLADELLEGFRMLAPLYQYLWKVILS